MNWFKRSQLSEVKDHLERILGLGEYKPEPMSEEEKAEWKKNRKPREPMHSMDMGDYEGEDDGW